MHVRFGEKLFGVKNVKIILVIASSQSLSLSPPFFFRYSSHINHVTVLCSHRKKYSFASFPRLCIWWRLIHKEFRCWLWKFQGKNSWNYGSFLLTLIYITFELMHHTLWIQIRINKTCSLVLINLIISKILIKQENLMQHMSPLF